MESSEKMGEVVELFPPAEGEGLEALNARVRVNGEEVEGTIEHTCEEGCACEADAPAPPDYEMIAMQVAQFTRNTFQGGDRVVVILVNPDLEAGFRAAWQALPDEVVPPQIKEKLPIQAEPQVPTLHVLTGKELEEQFLVEHFGERGNGLIPRFQQYLQQNPQQAHVQLTVDVLRTLYFLDLRERLMPRIERPPLGAEIYQALRKH